MADVVQDIWLKEFEELGEDQVRERTAAGIWGVPDKARLARQWLELRSTSLAREANDLARRANDAAREANDPATRGGGDKARAPNAEPTAKSEASNALAAMKAIHDGPHRGPVRQANHSADETTQRYPANPRVLRGYGYHLSGPSLLVSTHPSPPADHGVSTNACFALSIDHDLKRLRKL